MIKSQQSYSQYMPEATRQKYEADFDAIKYKINAYKAKGVDTYFPDIELKSLKENLRTTNIWWDSNGPWKQLVESARAKLTDAEIEALRVEFSGDEE